MTRRNFLTTGALTAGALTMPDSVSADMAPVNFLGTAIAPMAAVPNVPITLAMVTYFIRYCHYLDPMFIHYDRNSGPMMVHGRDGYNGQLGQFGYQFDIKTGFMIYTGGKVVKRFRS